MLLFMACLALTWTSLGLAEEAKPVAVPGAEEAGIVWRSKLSGHKLIETERDGKQVKAVQMTYDLTKPPGYDCAQVQLASTRLTAISVSDQGDGRSNPDAGPDCGVPQEVATTGEQANALPVDRPQLHRWRHSTRCWRISRTSHARCGLAFNSLTPKGKPNSWLF